MPTYSQGLDLEAHIRVNGEPIHEYIDKDAPQESNVISRYVEATAGSEFEVAYFIFGPNTTNNDIRVSCSIDGTVVRKLVHRHQGQPLWYVHRIIRGVLSMHRNSQVVRAFRFSDVSPNEQGFISELSTTGLHVQSNTHTTSMLGEIKLEFYFGTAEESSNSVFLGNLPELEEISEKSQKGDAVSLCIKLGTPHHCEFPLALDFKPEESPFATIVTKYRTCANLQKLHIIPPGYTAPPPPTSSQNASGSSNAVLPPLTAVKKEFETDLPAQIPQRVPDKSYINSGLVSSKPALTQAPKKATVFSQISSTLSLAAPAPRSLTPSPAVFSSSQPSAPPQTAPQTQRLPRRDLLTLIKLHRKTTAGLENMSDAELEAILEDYREEERAKRMAEAQAEVSVKRECDYEEDLGSKKKRKKEEEKTCIVID